MAAPKFPDTAEYRLEVLAKRTRDTDRRAVYVRTGWSLVKYPGQAESWEPMDLDSTGCQTYQSDFKQYNGFVFVEDGYPFTEHFPGGNLIPER